MNTPTWMTMQSYDSTRTWARRGRGRRASDRPVKLETILAVGATLAWAWGVYELTLLVLR
jgi:hypothetical protein